MGRKRGSQLVCQHFENVSRRVLEQYQDVIRDYVRGRTGVYALYRRGKLYYVGLAGSLLGRLKTHLRDKHKDTWDRFSIYLTIGPAFMREIESLLLHIANPPGNKVVGGFVRSENLLPRVKADYRRRHKQEEDDIFGRSLRSETEDATTPAKPKQQSAAWWAHHSAVWMARHWPRVKRLRARYKGQLLKASVLRNGEIRFQGKVYGSVSAAGRAASGHACNGWRFWTYERAPGDWVELAELRR